MKHEHVYEICNSYLSLLGSEFLYQDASCIQVKLSEEADRKIANRPFYWAFIDRTNTVAEPLTYTFYFSSKTDNIPSIPASLAEVITNGNEKFEFLINDINRCGKSVLLYENHLLTEPPMPFEPWLSVNVMITYHAALNKSKLLSLGISLLSNAIVPHFMENVLLPRSFTPKISANPSSLQTPFDSSSLARLKTYINDLLLSEDHSWAISSVSVSQLPIFSPQITIEIINCGIFYLLNQSRNM